MKKVFIILLVFAFALSLWGCNGGKEEEVIDVPPGFSVIQNQLRLSKHNQTGENVAFSKAEFEEFLGEELTYITVTTLPADGVLVCNGSAVLKGQTISADNLEFMKFVPNSNCIATAFSFTCDSAGYHGKEMVCELAFSENANISPVVKNGELKTVSGISVYGDLDIAEPNGDEFTIDIITYPTDGTVAVNSDGSIVYTPDEGFHGTDRLVFTVTDYFGEMSSEATLDITVDENESGIVFADMADDPDHLYAHRMCANDVMVYRVENGSYYFDPDEYVTKMDFLVMLMCAANLDEGITAVADSAISDDDGLSSGLKGFLSAASEKGWIKLENGKFSPTANVTLADAAYMTAKALGLPSPDSSFVSAGTDADVDNFLAASVNAGIIDSKESDENLTKSDVAEILCRIEDYILQNNIQNIQ